MPWPVDQSVVLPADLSRPVGDHGGTRSSFHLTMRDGVRIAIDLWLPPAAFDRRVPAALRSTRYIRATVDNPPLEHMGGVEVDRWVSAGFALVLVDARGTGASFGTWPRPWNDDQRDDLREIVDWIVAQEWSDGTVGGYGTSYDGSTAHLLAATGHPAVRAVVPRFALLDPFHHIAAPGGVPLDWFLQIWSTVNWHLDGHPDMASVPPPLPIEGGPRPTDDDDTDRTLLAKARAEHRDNWDLWGSVGDFASREELIGEDGVAVEGGTALGRLGELRAADVPMWLWSAWYDGAYAAAQLAQLADPGLDVRVTIGPWTHGAGMPTIWSPFASDRPMDPTMDSQQRMMADFLLHHGGKAVADPSPRRLRYYTFGEEAWHEADTWPPEGVAMSRWFLDADGVLSKSAPTAAGADTYDIDFEASTGTSTRWHSLIAGPPVIYPDRAEEDCKLLTWTSEVLDDDVEITGTPAVTLHVTSSAPDGAFFVYLEVVEPDGVVTYLTEGQLRAIHRRSGDSAAPYETFGPWHTYKKEHVSPLVAGEVAELSFTLWPISVLVRAGHRIRIALAGADAELFRRIPASGPVTIDVLRGPGPASFVDLPVRGVTQ